MPHIITHFQPNTSLLNSSLEWKLVNTFNHNATVHTENLSVDLSSYKEVKVIGSINGIYFVNSIDTSFINDLGIVLVVGGYQIYGDYNTSCNVTLFKKAVKFDTYSLTLNATASSGIFYIYVR